MSPVFTRSSHAGLGLVDNQRDAVVLTQHAQLFEKPRSRKLVTNAAHRLDNYGSDAAPLSVLADNLFNFINTPVFFGIVLVLKFRDREPKLGERSFRPGERREAMGVGVGRRNRQGCSRGTVVAVFKSKDEAVAD